MTGTELSHHDIFQQALRRLEEIARTGGCAELDRLGLRKNEGYMIYPVAAPLEALDQSALREKMENSPKIKAVREKASELGLILNIRYLHFPNSRCRLHSYDLYCNPADSAGAGLAAESLPKLPN